MATTPYGEFTSPTGRLVTEATPLDDSEIADLRDYLEKRAQDYRQRTLPASDVRRTYARLLATIDALTRPAPAADLEACLNDLCEYIGNELTDGIGDEESNDLRAILRRHFGGQS